MGLAETSGLGIGCVKLGSAGSGGTRSGVRLIHEALDNGVRLFDTADAYGNGTSELVLGQALRKRRDGVFIATKGGYRFTERSAISRAARGMAGPLLRKVAELRPNHATSPGPRHSETLTSGPYTSRDFSTAYLRQALEGSLRRLGVDHVDLYQLHGPVEVCDHDVVELMHDLCAEGKVGGFGVGLETLDHASGWLKINEISAIQLPFGVLDPEAGEQVIGLARGCGVPVIARGVLAAGLLTDADAADAMLRPNQHVLRQEMIEIASVHDLDPVSMALRYVRDVPGVAAILIGVSSTHNLDQALRHHAAPPLSVAASDEVSAAIARYLAARHSTRSAHNGH